MLSRGSMCLWSMLPIILVFSTAPSGSSSSRLVGNTCYVRMSKLVTYLKSVRHAQRIRTRECRFFIICKTVYRIRYTYRMVIAHKQEYIMKAECCRGNYELNGRCIEDEIPTSTMAQQKTVSDDINRVGVGNQTSTWIFGNTTYPPIIGQNKELHITDSNQTSIIVGFIACTLSVFIVIVVLVVYKRRKKAAKYMSEIPCSQDIMPLPPKSKKDCSARQEGLNYRNLPPTDENFYMSMDSGCKLQVPSVKMMLATRGSGYRFSSLEEDARRRADSLYMKPDSATYNNQNSQVSIGTGLQDRKCQNKTSQGKTADIYINGQDINMADKVADENDENIYSEIRGKNYKRTDLVGGENGYSFIRMDCVKKSEAEDTDREAETSLYSSLDEGDDSKCNSNTNDGETENAPDSKLTNAGKTGEGGYDSLSRAKMRSNNNRRQDDTPGEREARDDACDSGIYTYITPDSDKDNEPCSDSTYDEPKNREKVDETEMQTGSDFYENCRRDSDECNNYDVPRLQGKDEEDAIYSDISSTTSPTTNTPVVAHSS